MNTRQIVRLPLAAAFVFILVLVFGGTLAFAAPDKKALTAPTNLSVTGRTETTISLAWGPSRSSTSFSYRVRLIDNNNPAYNTLATVPQSQTTYTARFLSPNHSFTITVFAVDARGRQSADSNAVATSTLADTTPPSTPSLTAETVSPSTVRLTWTESTDNLPLNCCSYLLFVNGARITQHINWQAAPAGSLAVNIRHLTPATAYTFRVDAYDYQLNIAPSNNASATTEASSDTTPPTAPTNLHLVRDYGCAEVDLGWTQATDDVDPQFAIEYEIYVNGILSPLPVSAGVDVDFVYGTGFPDNIFEVKAVDRSGNTSAASAPLQLSLWPC